jgi:nucleoside-diphosphate-sugar epimerase
MKITVTGAAGHLGKVVVRALHAEGHEIVATDVAYTRDLPVRLDLQDLRDEIGCYRLVEGSEVLVHLGNLPGFGAHSQGGFLHNVATDVNIFQAAQDCGVRKILFASSIQVISGIRRGREEDLPFAPSSLPYLPLDGDTPPNPGMLYPASKIAGENLLLFYAKVHGLSTVAIRFPALIDPASAQFHLPRIQRDARLDEGFAYLALPDAATLVSAIIRAELPGFRIYLPASPGTTLPTMTLDEIVARFYPEVPVRAKGKLDRLVNTDAITRDTGWMPKLRLF